MAGITFYGFSIVDSSGTLYDPYSTPDDKWAASGYIYLSGNGYVEFDLTYSPNLPVDTTVAATVYASGAFYGATVTVEVIADSVVVHSFVMSGDLDSSVFTFGSKPDTIRLKMTVSGASQQCRIDMIRLSLDVGSPPVLSDYQVATLASVNPYGHPTVPLGSDPLQVLSDGNPNTYIDGAAVGVTLNIPTDWDGFAEFYLEKAASSSTYICVRAAGKTEWAVVLSYPSGTGAWGWLHSDLAQKLGGSIFVELQATDPANFEARFEIPGGACSYSISPTEFTFDSIGGSGLVYVVTESTCSWSVSSSSPWIIPTTLSGVGNGQVEFSITENVSESSRQGSLTIAGQAVLVSQDGTVSPPSGSDGYVDAESVFAETVEDPSSQLLVSPTCMSANWLGENIDIDITCPPDFTWTITTEEDSSVLSFTKTSGVGSYTVTATVSKNGSGAVRVLYFEVEDILCSIHQPPQYYLPEMGRVVPMVDKISFPQDGGIAKVRISAALGLWWDATPLDPWATLALSPTEIPQESLPMVQGCQDLWIFASQNFSTEPRETRVLLDSGWEKISVLQEGGQIPISEDVDAIPIHSDVYGSPEDLSDQTLILKVKTDEIEIKKKENSTGWDGVSHHWKNIWRED